MLGSQSYDFRISHTKSTLKMSLRAFSNIMFLNRKFPEYPIIAERMVHTFQFDQFFVAGSKHFVSNSFVSPFNGLQTNESLFRIYSSYAERIGQYQRELRQVISS